MIARADRLPVRPATAWFAVLLVLGTLQPVSYLINAEHWLPFVAAASAIREGDWPLAGGYDSGYGLLCPGFLTLWLLCFGLSGLSLSMLVMLSNVVAGTASFVLIRGLTSSRLLALVGALYPVLGVDEMAALNARVFAVSSAFRAPVQIAIGALLLYLCLRDRNGRLWPAFLFGLVVLWNPSFGAFAALGFLAAQGYLMVQQPDRVPALRATLAMLAGIAVPFVVIVVFSGASAALSQLYSIAVVNIELSLLGYANQAQQFDPVVAAGFVAFALYLALLLRRLSRGRRLTRTYLFVGASFIAAIPYAGYALSRSDPSHYLPAYWCLMPILALFASGFFRFFSMRSTFSGLIRSIGRSRGGAIAALLLALAGCALWWGSFPLQRILAPAPFAASHPRIEHAGSRGHDAPVDIDPRLIAACRAGLVVLSYSDGWIHAIGDCYSPLRLPSVTFLMRRDDLERTTQRLAAQQAIVLDHGRNAYAAWRGDMLQDFRLDLVRQGFGEARGCGDFSVLSKTDPTPVLRKLCGPTQADR